MLRALHGSENMNEDGSICGLSHRHSCNKEDEIEATDDVFRYAHALVVCSVVMGVRQLGPPRNVDGVIQEFGSVCKQ